jgi:hypothetical protein
VIVTIAVAVLVAYLAITRRDIQPTGDVDSAASPHVARSAPGLRPGEYLRCGG